MPTTHFQPMWYVVVSLVLSLTPLFTLYLVPALSIIVIRSRTKKKKKKKKKRVTAAMASAAAMAALQSSMTSLSLSSSNSFFGQRLSTITLSPPLVRYPHSSSLPNFSPKFVNFQSKFQFWTFHALPLSSLRNGSLADSLVSIKMFLKKWITFTLCN